MEDKEKSVNGLFSSSVILFAIPAYLYLCAYQYEKGICEFYGIPKELISTSLTSNLSFSVSLFFVVYIIYFLPHFLIYPLIGDKWKKSPQILPFIRSNIIGLCILSFFIWSSTYKIDWFKSALASICVFAVINVLAWFQFRHLKKELLNREYEAIANEWNSTVSWRKIAFPLPDFLNIKSAIFDNINDRQISLIISLFIIVGLSGYIGNKEAYSKNTYELSGSKEDWVFLRKYGDDLILKKYDSSINRLGDSLMIIKVSPTSPVKFTTKTIGSIHYHNK
jgi:hypothetical protein